MFVFGLASRSVGYEPSKPKASPSILRFEWHDEARDRDVPVKVYLPTATTRPAPVIIFSHGLGGSREGYEYLGNYWSGCGYVCVHVQHHGSDNEVLKDGTGPMGKMQALRMAAMDPTNSTNRPKDISYVLDQLTKLQRDSSSPLYNKMDLTRVGVAGHSFGGFTTMASVGQHTGSGNLADPRIKAAIQMSAPVARPALRGTAYADIKVPVFHMTGTLDDSPVGETSAAERRIPYDSMKGPETCLLILNGGDHMVFAGGGGTRSMMPGAGGNREKDETFRSLICASSIAFWDAELKGDTAAHTWLMNGGFTSLLGSQGTFEKKGGAR